MGYRIDTAALRQTLKAVTWPDVDAGTLNRAVLGDMTDALRAALSHELLIAGTRARIDAVTCSVLRHHGINPAVLFALCIHATDVTVHDAAGLEIVNIGAEGLSRVRLGDDPAGPTWRTTGGLLENLPFVVPETMSAQSAGQPVSSVMTHPAIDPLDLRIAGMGREWDKSYIQVETFDWVEGEALAALLKEPTPCA